MDLALTIYLVIGLILSFPMIFTRDESEHPIRNMIICIFLWPILLLMIVIQLLIKAKS